MAMPRTIECIVKGGEGMQWSKGCDGRGDVMEDSAESFHAQFFM